MAAATAVAAANLHFQSELTEIVRWFNEADVPVMLLKGAALNLTVYPRPDLRPMSDLDLLVRPGDAERALSLLKGHGCRRGLELVRRDHGTNRHALSAENAFGFGQWLVKES